VKIISISDIHILSEEDPYYDHLLQVIRDEIQKDDHLILAGDIFEFLVGRPADIQRRYKRFFQLLKQIGQMGAQIHYVEGNHDFHLGKIFSKIENCHVYDSELTLTLGDKKFYVAHGDLIDQQDKGYLALRKLFRSPIARLTATVLPEFLLQAIGKKSGDLSDLKRRKVPSDARKIRTEYTRKIFRNFAKSKIDEGFDFVILGHCHDADEKSFQMDERTGHYMNVGYPKEHQNYIKWVEGDPKLSRIPLSLSED